MDIATINPNIKHLFVKTPEYLNSCSILFCQNTRNETYKLPVTSMKTCMLWLVVPNSIVFTCQTNQKDRYM